MWLHSVYSSQFLSQFSFKWEMLGFFILKNSIRYWSIKNCLWQLLATKGKKNKRWEQHEFEMLQMEMKISLEMVEIHHFTFSVPNVCRWCSPLEILLVKQCYLTFLSSPRSYLQYWAQIFIKVSLIKDRGDFPLQLYSFKVKNLTAYHPYPDIYSEIRRLHEHLEIKGPM